MKIVFIATASVMLMLVVFNILYIVMAGSSIPVPDISREPRVFGEGGEELRFAVIGDSLTVGQGGDYEKGIAVTSASKLAQKRRVSMINVGVSGARTKEALNYQLPKVIEFNPDIVLITISANDINHMTSLSSVDKDFREIVKRLKTNNPDMSIITTGTPAMGSIPRFPWPTSYVLGARASAMNRRFDKIVEEYGLYFARVAERTGKQFAADDSLSAEDKFHPSDKGYVLWNEVISEQLKLVDM